MNIDLLKEFAEQALGKSLAETTPVWLTGWETATALWPLNERFRTDLHQIRSLPYESAYEAEADAALWAFAFRKSGADWADLSAGAWRVLLERQQQGISGALFNEAQGREVIPVPSGLSPDELTAVAALLVLYRMTLHSPAADRAGFELPPGAMPESLRRH